MAGAAHSKGGVSIKAEIIAVGDELLMGDIVNTNTAFLARRLSQMGFTVHRQSVVGDDENEIAQATRRAVSRSHITVFCGGLGPTDDDLTKETVAKVLGLRLVNSPSVENAIHRFFEQKGLKMADNNLKQAMIIEGSRVLYNENGTAPGLFIQSKNQAIVLLPGPPAELEPMFDKVLRPRLEKFADLRTAHASLHVFGIGEGELETKVKDLLYGENPHAALYAKTGQVQITITARAQSVERANELLKAQIALFRERLGDLIYSENGEEMHEAVAHMLQKMNLRISVAESCTGGLMAAQITSVTGASRIFELGFASYSDRAKERALGVDAALLRRHTAVSSSVAAEMAKGAMQRAKAAIGVGITGIAGPTNEGYMDMPVGLVYIAVSDKSRVFVKKFNFGNMRSRDTIRELCVLHAFDMVRRLITNLPIEGAKQFTPKEIAEMEREGKPRSKASLKVEKGIVGALCMAVLLTGGWFGVDAIRARVRERVYLELQNSFNNAEPAALSERLSGLVERNPDTLGWLSVDGATLDCVVVRDREDGFYETHDFDGTDNSLGCPHVPAAVDPAAAPRNLTVYGKPAETSGLFGSLENCTEQTVAERYLIHFESVYGSSVYKICSVFLANANPEQGETQTAYTLSDFGTPEAFQEFVIEMKMRSMFNIDTDVRSTDSFLTLVSELEDWDGARLVVVARRLRDGETTAAPEEAIAQNKAALYPQAYYDLTGGESVVNASLERDRWLNWLIGNDKNAENPDGESQSPAGNLFTQEETPDGQTDAPVVTVTMNGSLTTGQPAEIVSRIVAAEMSASYDDEAIKAQAVATISLLQYTLGAGEIPDVQGATPTQRVTDLVSQVIGEGMFYDGAAAFTPYFAVSAGKTNPSEAVFGQAYPYLVSVESRYDYQVTGYNRETTFSREALKLQLEQAFGVQLSDDPGNWIEILSETEGGYVDEVLIDGQVTVTGYDMMQALSLRSSCFTVRSSSTHVIIRTLGSGHGVGMSQAGANEYAVAMGWDYRQILEHYYPGVTFGAVEW